MVSTTNSLFPKAVLAKQNILFSAAMLSNPIVSLPHWPWIQNAAHIWKSHMTLKEKPEDRSFWYRQHKVFAKQFKESEWVIPFGSSPSIYVPPVHDAKGETACKYSRSENLSTCSVPCLPMCRCTSVHWVFTVIAPSYTSQATSTMFG